MLRSKETAGDVEGLPVQLLRLDVTSFVREALFSNETVGGSAGSTTKCCWPLRAVVPLHSQSSGLTAARRQINEPATSGGGRPDPHRGSRVQVTLGERAADPRGPVVG
jgi:hypothetical protein